MQNPFITIVAISSTILLLIAVAYSLEQYAVSRIAGQLEGLE